MCRSPKDHRTTLRGSLRLDLRVRAQHCCTPACPAVKLYRPPVFSSSSRLTFNCRPSTSSPHRYLFTSAFRPISSISPPKYAQTTPPSSIHSLFSLISAKPRTRTPAPGRPKTSPSDPPHNLQYKVGESPPFHTCKPLPTRTTLPASSRHPLRRLENIPSPSNTPSDIQANCIDKRSHPTETSSADDRPDNESSSAHKINFFAATWTNPNPPSTRPDL